MLRFIRRNLAAHKIRLILSALAVVLGVAFVAGTFIFTDTLSKTFDDLFAQTTSDVELTPQQAFTTNRAPRDREISIPASLVDRVEKSPDVERAEGFVQVDGVYVIGDDGKVVGTPGAPAFGTSWSDDEELSPYRLVPGEGKGPTAAGQVAIDTQTAESGGLAVGDTIKIVTPRGPSQAKVTGIFRFGASGNLAGASLTAFDPLTAQKLLLAPGQVSAISVKSKAGFTQDETKASIEKTLTPSERKTVKVQTGKEAADDQAATIAEALSFVNIFLLVFAILALIVGSFIILNTFSMLVAQRSRELALLRALGASRRQVTGAVLGEAVVVGIVGAIVGIGLGLVLALGLKQLISTLGGDLPTGALVVQPRTVIVALIVGLFVTVAAAYIPARRASRIPPVAAMRAEVALPQRSLRNRVIIGLILLVAGVISLIIGVGKAGATGATYVGAGSALLLFTVIVLSPVIASPVIGFLGIPIRRRGIAGRIAVNNAQRNRRRTASTASALMIGLALVGAMSILGASTKASTSASVEGVLRADFIVTSTTFRGFSPVVAQDVKAVPGVGVVSPIRSAPGQINKRVEVIGGIDPATVSQVLALDFQQGSVAGAKDGFIVDDETFTSSNLKIGQSINVLFADGNTVKLPINGTFARDGLLSGYVTSNANLVKAGQPDQDSAVYATLKDGANPVTVKADIDKALADLPTVVVKDQSEYKASVVGQVDQILAIIYALLGLAIIISILGIVNTLALSVVERTREIGLLRAVGMSRKQMKSSIRWESMVIAVFGALLGLGLGVIFGVSLQKVLRNEGIQLLAIPWGQLIAFLVVSALVGVLAALWPARRASRLNVLDAISSE